MPRKASAGLGTPRDRDGLAIEIGRRPFGAGQGAIFGELWKAYRRPKAPYRLSLPTCTYRTAASYASVSRTLDLRGKLTRLPDGGFTGRSCDARHSHRLQLQTTAIPCRAQLK